MEIVTKQQMAILEFLGEEEYRHIWLHLLEDGLRWYDRYHNEIVGPPITSDDKDELDWLRLISWRKPNPDGQGWKPGYYITDKALDILTRPDHDR